MKNNIVQAISYEFSRILLYQLGKDKVLAAAICNELSANKDICHTHDFFDSNLIMAEAIINMTGKDPEVDDINWNAAWYLAKKNNFYIFPLLHYRLVFDITEIPVVISPDGREKLYISFYSAMEDLIDTYYKAVESGKGSKRYNEIIEGLGLKIVRVADERVEDCDPIWQNIVDYQQFNEFTGIWSYIN